MIYIGEDKSKGVQSKEDKTLVWSKNIRHLFVEF